MGDPEGVYLTNVSPEPETSPGVGDTRFIANGREPSECIKKYHKLLPLTLRRSEDHMELLLGSIQVDEFHDPFYSETLARFPRLRTMARHISKATLGGSAELIPATALAGIIFHISRCGSTLATHLLRDVGGCVVYSEPPALNDLLMPPWPSSWTENEIAGGVRTVVSQLATAAEGRPYVIKLRSWNTLFASTIIRALPDVPWVFITRDPVEVAVSVIAKPPTWLRAFHSANNPFASVLEPEAIMSGAQEVYIAGMLGAFTRATGKIDLSGGILERYENLPDAAWNRIAGHFALSVNRRDRTRMRERSCFYSKDPERRCRFSPDSETKQTLATAALRDAVRRYAAPDFNRLFERFGS